MALTQVYTAVAGDVITAARWNAEFANIYGGQLVSVIDAAGDLLVGTAADTAGRLAIGTWGQFPGVNSAVTALEYSGPIVDNPIINPAMEVWQRGTSFAAAGISTYQADRWQWYFIGTGVVTISRSTNVPTVAQAGVLFNYAADIDVTTADASIAAGDRYIYYQAIEGYNFRHFAQRAFTVSFWVRDTITGEHAVAFKNSGLDRSYVATYTVNVADTWEYKTVNVAASPSAGTWDYTNGVGLLVVFTLAAGSTFQTTAGSWQTGNFDGTATTVNSMSSASNFFRITGVKMELGSVATPLQFRSFQDELQLCYRYYEKTFPYATVPAQGAGVLGALENRVQATGGGAGIYWFYKASKRVTATITTYNPTQANANWRDTTAGSDKTVTVDPSTTANLHGVFISEITGTTQNDYCHIHAIAVAEL